MLNISYIPLCHFSICSCHGEEYHITCRPPHPGECLQLTCVVVVILHQQGALQAGFLAQPQARPRKYWRAWSAMSVSMQTETKKRISFFFFYNCFLCVLSATQLVDLDDFVEMTKKYAQGIVPSAPHTGSQVTVKTKSSTADNRSGEVKDPIRKNRNNMSS